MSLQQLENGILIDHEAIDRSLSGLPGKQATALSKVIGGYIDVAGDVHHLYNLQKQEGFYPSDMTAEEIKSAVELETDPLVKEALMSPYTLVRRKKILWYNIDGLQAVDYRNESPFKDVIQSMKGKMYRVSGLAKNPDLGPRGDLIVNSLEPQIRALEGGGFWAARVAHLNTRLSPPDEFVLGLFDRYADHLLGWKFAWNAMANARDDGLTDYYNKMLAIALKAAKGLGFHRAVVGDATILAGQIAEYKFSGNTLPSEDPLRRNLGSIPYIFPNVFGEKLETKIIPALEKHIPDATLIPGWRRMIKRAGIADLVLHEGFGHSQVDFGEETLREFEGEAMTVKELACEILAHQGILSLPRSIMGNAVKHLAIAVSLAWACYDIEKGTETYARAGQEMIKYYQNQGCLRVIGDMVIKDIDLDLMSRAASRFQPSLVHIHRSNTKGNSSGGPGNDIIGDEALHTNILSPRLVLS